MLLSKFEYEEIANNYALKNGIVKFHVNGNVMWFYKSYKQCKSKVVSYLPPTTIKYCMNLDTGNIITEVYKQFRREGLENVYNKSLI